MSPRQWFALLCFYTTYLFFGASIFYHIEHGYEEERRAEQLEARISINDLLVSYTSRDDIDIQNYVLQQVSDYCGKPVTNHTLDEYVDPYLWTFYHSVFFAFTVCSTLGYGNIAPTHTFGQYFMIVYALIGMPVNGILYAYLGEFFGETFTGAYNRYKAYKMANNKNYVPRRLGMIAQISLYLVPASIVLIFLPSCLFTYFEGWSYSVSVYYSFVTLSTIGFGDYIPTFQPHQERTFGVYFQLYQAFIIFWFVFGLSYLLMLIGFIATGMRSKRIARLEQQLSENIKITHNRIWNGVTKDVSYLRRILNEISMMKIKPVYNEPGELEEEDRKHRSASCPNLTMYQTYEAPVPRQRAFSVAFEQPVTFNRHSDTDLSKIDKKRTFEGPNNTVFNTGAILAKVVQALGTINPLEDEISDDFYEQEIDNGMMGLSDPSNRGGGSISSGMSTATSEFIYSTPPTKPRARAVSEYRAPPLIEAPDTHEWTWNGTNAQIQEFRHIRSKSVNKVEDLMSSKLNGSHPFVVNIDEEKKHEETVHPEHQTFLHKINPFKKKSLVPEMEENIPIEDDADTQKYLDKTIKGRLSRISIAKHLPQAMSKRRPTLIPPSEGQDNVGFDRDTRDYMEKTVKGRESRVSISKTHQPVTTKRRATIFAPSDEAPQHTSFEADAHRYIERTAKGRESKISPHMTTATNRRRPSLFTTPEPMNQNLLENTTIADLIRALAEAHTREFEEELGMDLGMDLGVPQRKQSITPISPANIPPTGRRASIHPSHVFPAKFGRRQSHAALGVKFPGHLPERPTQLPSHTQSQFLNMPSRRLSIIPSAHASNIVAVQPAAIHHRRQSLRPSPLAVEPTAEHSGRFTISRRLSYAALAIPKNTKNLLRRSPKTQDDERHSSLSELYEKSDEQERKDSDD